MISIRATDYILRSSESKADLFYISMESGFNSKLQGIQMEKKINTREGFSCCTQSQYFQALPRRGVVYSRYVCCG